MKNKIFACFILILFLSTMPVFAGICLREKQIYTNVVTQAEKYLPCNNISINKVTSFPFSTTSYIKSGVSYNATAELCGGRNASDLQKMSFFDFSLLDRVKIIMNILFFTIVSFILGRFYWLILDNKYESKSLIVKVFFKLAGFIFCLGLTFIYFLFLEIAPNRIFKSRVE